MVEWALTDAGYAVNLAADGESALFQAAQSPPDLILLDLMMPTVSGQQVIQELRSGSLSRSIPVVVLSAAQHVGRVIERAQERADEDQVVEGRGLAE
jgi:DNA-binding response OmpR family regulator